jgi:hypothetical protein
MFLLPTAAGASVQRNPPQQRCWFQSDWSASLLVSYSIPRTLGGFVAENRLIVAQICGAF